MPSCLRRSSLSKPSAQSRRGPRSQLAFLRRSVPRCRRALPDAGLGEIRPSVSESINNDLPQHHNVIINDDSACNSAVNSVKSVNGVCIFL